MQADEGKGGGSNDFCFSAAVDESCRAREEYQETVRRDATQRGSVAGRAHGGPLLEDAPSDPGPCLWCKWSLAGPESGTVWAPKRP